MEWDSERWPNFSVEEMQCSHTGKCEMDVGHMDKMQILRDLYGRLDVSSGYRDVTPELCSTCTKTITRKSRKIMVFWVSAMNSHVINGLVNKRNELAREQREHDTALRQIVEAIDVLDKAIKVFDPKFNLKTLEPKRRYRKNVFFRNGQMSTTLIDVMREAGEPLTTLEIAKRAAAKVDLVWNKIDQDAFQKTLRPTLKKLKEGNIFRQVKKVKNGQIVWEVVGLD